jgi:oxazoline/thiazoline synthase
VLTDDYLQPQLAEFNRQAVAAQVPWLLVKPFGSIVWLGPIFEPQVTACWDCLASRLQANRPVASFVQRSGLTAPIAPPALFPATIQTALGMAATEVFKWIVAGKNDRLTNTLITYDAPNRTPLSNAPNVLAVVKLARSTIANRCRSY